MLFEMDQLDEAVNGFVDLAPFLVPDAQAVGDIVLDVHFWKERVRLKYDAGAALPCRKLSHIFAVKDNPAGIRDFKAGDDPQDRRLAAARSTEQHDDLVLIDAETNVFEHDRLAKALAETHYGHRLFAEILRRDVNIEIHREIYSASSQSRAKNKMLKMTNENSASTIAIAFAASTWPSLNFAKM